MKQAGARRKLRILPRPDRAWLLAGTALVTGMMTVGFVATTPSVSYAANECGVITNPNDGAVDEIACGPSEGGAPIEYLSLTDDFSLNVNGLQANGGIKLQDSSDNPNITVTTTDFVDGVNPDVVPNVVNSGDGDGALHIVTTGTGDIIINHNKGTFSGTAADAEGIFVQTAGAGADITVNTAAGTTVSSTFDDGIDLNTSGGGKITAVINGAITAGNNRGDVGLGAIALGTGGVIDLTLTATGTIASSGNGIEAQNIGSNSITVLVDGVITNKAGDLAFDSDPVNNENGIYTNQDGDALTKITLKSTGAGLGVITAGPGEGDNGIHSRAVDGDVEISLLKTYDGADGYYAPSITAGDNGILVEVDGSPFSDDADVSILNEGSIHASQGAAIAVFGADDVSIINKSYQSAIGEYGDQIEDSNSVSIDNGGGLTAGIGEDGIAISNIFGFGLSGDPAVEIENYGYYDERSDDDGSDDEVLGGGVIAGYYDGINIDDVWNGDIVIDNAGWTDTAGLADVVEGVVAEGDPIFRDGGLILGRWDDGIEIHEADGRVLIYNDNTKESVIDLAEILGQAALSGTFSGVLTEGSLYGSGYTAGIWGYDNGIEISEVEDYVGISNTNGVIVGVEGDGIRLRYVDWAVSPEDIEEDFEGADLPDYLAELPVSFYLDNSAGGLVWGGDDGLDIRYLFGNTVINNDEGTIFGQNRGIRIDGEGPLAGALISNAGGLIQGFYGNAIEIENVGVATVLNGIVDVWGDGVLEEDVTIGTLPTSTSYGGQIVSADTAISITDSYAALIANGAGGLIIGDGSWWQPVIELELSDGLTFNGTDWVAIQTGIIVNDGIMASRALPGFVYAASEEEGYEDETDWSSQGPATVRLSTFDEATFRTDLAGLYSYVLTGGDIDAEKLGEYRDAANDFLVTAEDGATLLVNNDVMVGNLDLDGRNGGWSSGAGNEVVNNGTWLVTGDWWDDWGTELSGGPNDSIYNNGLIQTAFGDDGYDSDDYLWIELNDFYNGGGERSSVGGFGVLSLADGDPNDSVDIYGDFHGVTPDEYEAGNRSYVAVDVDFEDRDSDRLYIGGDADGTTGLIVRNVGGQGQLGGWGIDVAYIDDDFDAPEPGVPLKEGDVFFISSLSDGYFEAKDGTGLVQDGLLAWYATIDDWSEREVELQSTLGPGAVNAPNVVTGAQNIFYSVYSLANEHNETFAPNGGGGADLPAAGGFDTASAPSGQKTGLWAKASGTWTERDDSATVPPGLTYDTGFDQSIYSILGGADMKWDADSPFRIGVYGGYVTSDLDMNLGGSSVDYEGGTVGVYGAYDTGAFYVNAAVQGDFLAADYSFAGESVDADVTNIGVAANAGYRFTMGRGFVEPIVSLAYVHTDVDDIDTAGAAVDFDNGDSFRVGAGGRIGTRFATGGATTELSLLGKVWNEFEDSNDVTVTSGGETLGFSSDIDGVFGEVQATATVTSADGLLSGFVSAGGQFGEDSTSWNARAGVRKGF